MDKWFKIEKQEVKINILAKPNTKKTLILGIRGEVLHISLHAKPHQGEANKELISFLATLFRVPKNQIIIKRGENSRHKQIIVPLTEYVKKQLSNIPLIC